MAAAADVHYRTCTLCEAMCGLEIRHAGEDILSIRGDAENAFSRGHICPKGAALHDLHTDPDRIRFPLRRTADGWERVDWDDALDDIAARVGAIQRAHGDDAVGLYAGNPTVHHLGAQLLIFPLVAALRTRNRFSATSLDQLPQQLATYELFGHQARFPVPDIDRTEFFLCLGGNPLASNGSLMTAPGMRHRIRELQARGGRFVVVDPRRTESAAVADQTPGDRSGYRRLAPARDGERDLRRGPRRSRRRRGLHRRAREARRARFPVLARGRRGDDGHPRRGDH